MTNLVDISTKDSQVYERLHEKYAGYQYFKQDRSAKIEIERSPLIPVDNFYGNPTSTTYHFRNIPIGVLIHLNDIDPELHTNAEYEITDTDTGKFLRLRHNGVTVDDEKMIQEILKDRRSFG
jgi:hypothetical protein